MTEIRIPKLNANDPSYLLVEWLVADGEPVSPEDPVAVVETSKATEELCAGHAGVLAVRTPAGTECRAGEVIAEVRAPGAPGPEEPTHPPPPVALPPEAATSPPLVVTEPARALLARHGLAAETVRERTGRRLIRRADVAAVVAAAGGARPASVDPTAPDPEPNQRVYPLSRLQQAVAAVVTESHRSVPTGFVAVKAVLDRAIPFARRLSRTHRCLIGVPELLVRAVAAQHTAFPLCFAHLRDASTVVLSDAAHVGVTVDVGDGLQVPVVHHADRLRWRELAETMMRFRTTAMRGAFRPGDLAGGAILVALHNDPDVTVAVPLVFPGQVCAVSLGGTQRELALDDGGRVTARPVAQLGLAYDHRVVNGADAVAFLRAVAGLLGSPDRLEPLGGRGGDG